MGKHLFRDKVTISYYSEGSRNDLGEPSRTLTERDSNVLCSLKPRSVLMAYEFPDMIRIMEQQGMTEASTYVMGMSAGQTIEKEDIITDADGNTYVVAWVVNWRNRLKTALLRQAN